MTISPPLGLVTSNIIDIFNHYDNLHSVVVVGSVVVAGVVGIFTSDNDNNMKGIRYF